MNIPRYALSLPAQTEFVTNADGYGDCVFTQLHRTGQIAVYKRIRISDKKHLGFETVNLKLVKAGTSLPGNKTVLADYESYPGGASFGRRAWHFWSLGAAIAKMRSVADSKAEGVQDDEPAETPVVAVSVDRIDTVAKPAKPAVTVKKPVVIPTGEFTQAEFAVANGLPERGSVYNMIQALVNVGAITVNRRVSTGAGRPKCMYVAA